MESEGGVCVALVPKVVSGVSKPSSEIIGEVGEDGSELCVVS